MFFCDVERKRIKKEHPTWSLGKVSKELGKRWRNAGSSTVKRYENKAKAQ
uniref:HMG box domain-containing protein n=1 Tax=viral metagenome TaxID=1070528 RepID=A0A6C0EKR9_9ZZZZ